MPLDNWPRIGFDATAAVTQGGGIGRYTRELLQALVEANGDFRYRVFSARPSRQVPDGNPVPDAENAAYRQIPLSPRWLYRLWYRLRLPLPVQLFTGAVDLFHSPDFVLPPIWGQVPTLLTVHDLSFVYYPDTFTGPLINYLNKVVPWSVSRATHVIVDSESTRRDLIKLYQTPGEKITVLYSGVHERFHPVSDCTVFGAMREKYALGDAPYILTVSTLQPRKNHKMLIRAFKPLAAQTSLNLVIAGGRGWLYEEMLAEVEHQYLQDRVRFPGFVDDADLPALYSDAAAFVFPSLYEGFGLPILEAMACGAPVVTSNASSLPEVAGNAALQISPNDEAAWTRALLRLVRDEDLGDRLRAAGFEQAERFRWADSARQLLEIYARMLEEASA